MIRQEELTRAAALQATAWMAERTAREAVQEIERRIAHGAAVEDGPLTFDRTLQMARRKMAREA